MYAWHVCCSEVSFILINLYIYLNAIQLQWLQERNYNASELKDEWLKSFYYYLNNARSKYFKILNDWVWKEFRHVYIHMYEKHL